MTVPAQYLSRMCQIERQDNNAVIKILNSTGADLNQFDFAVVDKAWCGVVNLDSVSTESLELTVEDGLQIITDNLDGAAVFSAQGDAVYWDDSAKTFKSVSAVGLFHVGYVLTPEDSDGNILFEKFRRPVEVTA